MKVSNTERIYCFELTERQFRKLIARDERAHKTGQRYDEVSGRYSYTGTFCDIVCQVEGVREVEYDPMFGCIVVVRIEEPFEEVLENVKKTLAKYVR